MDNNTQQIKEEVKNFLNNSKDLFLSFLYMCNNSKETIKLKTYTPSSSIVVDKAFSKHSSSTS